MRTFVAIPCMDMVHTQFMRSVLGTRMTGEVNFHFSQSSLVYDSRNLLTQRALEWGADRILWLDSDMQFEADFFERLSARMDQGLEYVSGLYFTRKDEPEPCIYQTVTEQQNEDGSITPLAEPIREIPDRIFEIAGSGFGGVMMSARLLERVCRTFGLPFSPLMGFGEDLSFCRRVQLLGVPMFCDPEIRMGHVGQYIFTEKDYRRKE